jgi:hypothetical protein
LGHIQTNTNVSHTSIHVNTYLYDCIHGISDDTVWTSLGVSVHCSPPSQLALSIRRSCRPPPLRHFRQFFTARAALSLRRRRICSTGLHGRGVASAPSLALASPLFVALGLLQPSPSFIDQILELLQILCTTHFYLSLGGVSARKCDRQQHAPYVNFGEPNDVTAAR